MGAQQAQALASADYNQARATGQQQRNRWQSDEGIGEIARILGGDYSNFNLDGLDEGGRKKAQDTLSGILQSYAMTGDTNFQQYAKGRQDMAVHDAAVYENNPVKAGSLAAAFGGGKFWGNAGNGQTFNHLTGQMQGSPIADAQIYKAMSAGNLDNTRAADVRMGMTPVGPDGIPAGGLSGMGIDDVWNGLIHTESRGRQSAVSPKGAVGVAQVMPGTAPIAAKLAGLPYDETRYKTDANYNAAIGKAYLKEMHRMFGGDMELALAAYNAGPGRVQEALRRDRAAGGNGTFATVSRFLPQETRNYVPTIADKVGGGLPMKYAGPAMARSTYGNKGE